ncbi:MAG: glutaredoxin family protein [Dehalococcoidia bacterium]|jgi:glutaredoxin-like protein NrdH|nr:glutaredoxin family protein [Dehalococcoidia bacterium]
MAIEHVSGRNAGPLVLYALSTCVWCRKTKQLLDDLGVAYDYVYVDLLDSNEKDHVIKNVERWNPSRTFPTLVVDNDRCIVGFKEDEIRDALSA